MKVVLIYALSGVGALVFEWAFRIYSKKFGAVSSKAQWGTFFWASAILLCAMTLMTPFDSRTFADWSPMFLVAFFSLQMAHQSEVLRFWGVGNNESSSGKTGGAGTPPSNTI